MSSVFLIVFHGHTVLQVLIFHDENELSDEVKFRFLCRVLLPGGNKDNE